MEHPLQPIVGESLSAVTFVMDYVQMAFNGACLTALTLPTVCFEDRVWAPNEPGWRDTLCGRLGVVVRPQTSWTQSLSSNLKTVRASVFH